MNIISRSNRLPYGSFETVTNIDDFVYNFPDDNPHSTLKRAETLVRAGYFLYLQNVYESDGPISSRIYNYGDTIMTTPLSSYTTDSNFALSNDFKSVIKVDLRKAKAGDWLLLECKSQTATQSNTLIWFHDKTQEEIEDYVDAAGNRGEYYFIQDYLGISLQQIYFAEGNGINLKTQDLSQAFKEKVERSTLDFGLFYLSSTLECLIANNMGFINIGNHSANIEVTMEDEYIAQVIAMTQTNSAVLDIKSRYNTDNNEIVLQVIEIKDYMYKVIVAQIKNNQSLVTEVHIGTTSQRLILNEKAPSLIDSLAQSTLVTVASYSDEFRLPTGYIYLTKFGNENDEKYTQKIQKNEVYMFLQGVKNMDPLQYTDFHFYYDSDFNSLKYQQALYNTYKDTPAYGIFTYRGVPITDTPNNLAYFSNQTIYVGEREFATSDIMIYLLSTISGYIGNLKDATHVTDYLFEKENINYVNVDTAFSFLQVRGFCKGKLKDLRFCLIEPILLKEIYDQGYVSYSAIQQGIDDTKAIFSEVFGVIVEIDLVEYKAISEYEMGARIQYSATFEDVQDVSEISIALDVGT